MPVLSGKAYWAKVFTPQGSKFDPNDLRYAIDVGNLDKKNVKIAEDHGLQIKSDPGDSNTKGDKGKFITLRRYAFKKDGTPNAKPVVIDAAMAPMTSLIGNGSDVNVEFRPFTFKNGKWAGKTGASLEKVQVVDLVAYEGTGTGSVEATELKPVDGGYEETEAAFP